MLRIIALTPLLLLAACATAGVSGSLQFPDHKVVQYVAKPVAISAADKVDIVATEAPDGTIKTDVLPADSWGKSAINLGQSAMGAMSFWLPFCAAGNC